MIKVFPKLQQATEHAIQEMILQNLERKDLSITDFFVTTDTQKHHGAVLATYEKNNQTFYLCMPE